MKNYILTFASSGMTRGMRIFLEDTRNVKSLSNVRQSPPLSSPRVVRLHILRPEEWFSDGVAYPKLPWLSTELLPRLVRWATESRTSEFKSTLSLLPVEKYSYVYQQLKDKYRDMVKVKHICISEIVLNRCKILANVLYGLTWKHGVSLKRRQSYSESC